MSAKLPDVRLEARLERLVEQNRMAMDKSIPQAGGSAHETKAAYRFLGKVRFEGEGDATAHSLG